MTAGVNILGRVELAREMLSAGKDAAAWLLRRVAAGEIEDEDLSMVQEGAGMYLRAIAEGDVAPRDVVSLRITECRSCPSRMDHWGDHDHLGFCGPPFHDRMDEDDPTCGCPIGPAAHVGSKACPQERFTSVTIETTNAS